MSNQRKKVKTLTQPPDLTSEEQRLKEKVRQILSIHEVSERVESLSQQLGLPYLGDHWGGIPVNITFDDAGQQCVDNFVTWLSEAYPIRPHEIAPIIGTVMAYGLDAVRWDMVFSRIHGEYAWDANSIYSYLLNNPDTPLSGMPENLRDMVRLLAKELPYHMHLALPVTPSHVMQFIADTAAERAIVSDSHGYGVDRIITRPRPKEAPMRRAYELHVHAGLDHEKIHTVLSEEFGIDAANEYSLEAKALNKTIAYIRMLDSQNI